jgi:hypothetical protein
MGRLANRVVENVGQAIQGDCAYDGGRVKCTVVTYFAG